MKKTFYSELAYLFGVIILALGTALMERADFGMSMVVAPAYVVHLKVSQIIPMFSFGMAEYCLQALLLLGIAAFVGKLKLKFLFSFFTAVFYGFTLDAMIYLVAFIPGAGIAGRILFFIAGMLACVVGVSLLFHTYISPEAYELFVKEYSEKFGTDINKTKTCYDICSCLVSIVLSFAFFGFGRFEGVKYGTVITALLNGFLIGQFSKLLEKIFEFKDGLNLKKWFE